MAERRKLALFFTYNEQWIGGTYYILNLVHALKTLDDAVKPEITVVGHHYADFEYIQQATGYPYLFYLKNRSGKPLWEKAINAFSLRILKKRWVTPKLPDRFDVVFPALSGTDYLTLIDDCKKVDWIPDFQDFHLPSFYTPQTLVEARQRNIAKAYLSKKIVLSSEDAKKDFRAQYPDSPAEIYVIPFSVTHPDLSGVNFETVKEKYGIDKPYFYAPNQYWVHKNHQLIIKAVKHLKTFDPDILVLFSGKEWDPRNQDYVPSLKKEVEEGNLQRNIRFLGFLDREEQLVIMKHAKAIIQPSLFEGWSTVIEDAKALNKFVFASDLRVHHEQLHTNVTFFDPQNELDLIEKLLRTTISVKEIDYNSIRKEHAQKFMTLFNSISNHSM